MADNSNAATGLTAALTKGNGPPPSTLAAQLVENISASTKSARSDENSELKGLFAVIQKVKDNPDLLKSQEDRLEHNHMLVYVYCRVVLDTIKLEDPFLDKSHVRAEAQKAINFLRFTINETPTVLHYREDNSSFLFRGEDALWIWLLPQLLRLLGHSKCVDLEGSIEGFLQYLLLVTARNGQLWGITSQMSLYLRAAFTGMLGWQPAVRLDTTDSFRPLRSSSDTESIIHSQRREDNPRTASGWRSRLTQRKRSSDDRNINDIQGDVCSAGFATNRKFIKSIGISFDVPGSCILLHRSHARNRPMAAGQLGGFALRTAKMGRNN